ncbi:hypothetical protein [Coprobacter tertius]|uniref:Lipoprotein n=1 Tax=Coprobacter tertius TaxID=2944915 RepID=A0ABT1MJB8_9BACT|nr:hypothetical protein [Coprobacter tertius]MCP9612724.1 hypothetical protein [Coprobacter tertius]
MFRKLISHIYYIIFITTLFSCENINRNKVSFTAGFSNIESSVKGYRFDRDSLFSSLINKIDSVKEFIPVIHFYVDSIVPQYSQWEYNMFSDYILTHPNKYLTKMKLDSLTLVTLAESDDGYFHYFLLDRCDSIIYHKFSDTYHTIILNRRYKDWNDDGENEIVEHRLYIGQNWTTTSEFVFSLKNDKLNLIFCIELSEENCVSSDPQGYGRLITRQYRKKGNGLYYITQLERRCNCSTPETKPDKVLSVTHYTISTNDLIKRYGNNTN